MHNLIINVWLTLATSDAAIEKYIYNKNLPSVIYTESYAVHGVFVGPGITSNTTCYSLYSGRLEKFSTANWRGMMTASSDVSTPSALNVLTDLVARGCH